MYLGDIRLGKTIEWTFTTRRFTTGVPFTLAGTPSLEAYETGNTTPITAGITLTVDYSGVTGLNHVSIVASGANGFATQNDISVVIAAGTVDGVSVVGETIGGFSIENRSAVMPTTADRTLDVSATGEADANTTQLAGQAVTAAAGVTFPTSVASPTNITAGTITTTTNLTNLPSIPANWITATGITDGAFTAAKFAAGAFDAVWTVAARTLTSFGTLVADIWAAATRTLTGTQAFNLTGDITGNMSGSVGSVTGAVGSVTGDIGGNVTGSVGSVAAGGITAASIATGAIDADALAADAVAEIADGVWDEAVDGATTGRESIRLANSANGAKLAGAATTTVTIRDLADTKARVTATVDADGNRTAVSRDLT